MVSLVSEENTGKRGAIGEMGLGWSEVTGEVAGQADHRGPILLPSWLSLIHI